MTNMVYNTLAANAIAQGITQAEALVDEFNPAHDDVPAWLPLALRRLAIEIGSGPDGEGGERSRYEFLDGSAIVTSESEWHFGIHNDHLYKPESERLGDDRDQEFEIYFRFISRDPDAAFISANPR